MVWKNKMKKKLLTFLCILMLISNMLCGTFPHLWPLPITITMEISISVQLASSWKIKSILCFPESSVVFQKKERLFGKALVPILIQCQLSSFLCFHCSRDLFLTPWLVCLCCLMCLRCCCPGSGSEGFAQKFVMGSVGHLWKCRRWSIQLIQKVHLSCIILCFFLCGLPLPPLKNGQ